MRRNLLLICLWFVLALLGGILAYLVYELLVAFGWTLIYSVRFRPEAWNSQTIAGVARGAILVCGIGYIMYIASIDNTLKRWSQSPHYTHFAVRRITILGSTSALIAVFLYIITNES